MEENSLLPRLATAEFDPQHGYLFTRPRTALMLDFTTAALAVIALFAALNVHGYDYSFGLQICNLFLLLALIMTKLFSSYSRPLSLPCSPAIITLSAFLGWVALSMLWSPVPGDSFLVVLMLSTGLWVTLLGFWANDRQWAFFRLLLIPLALLIISLTAHQAFVLNIARPSGFLVNWNTNSAFLGTLLIPYCAHYLRRVSMGRSHLFLGLFLAICAFGMSLGQGRGSLLVLTLALLLLFFSYRKQTHAYRGILLTCAWLISGYVLGDFLHGGMLGQRLSGLNAGSDLHDLGSGREYLWAAGWRMYLDHPWLGWGVGVFHLLYSSYRSPLHGEAGQYVHNDYFQFLIELGPIGLLLCLCWVVAIWHLAWRLFKVTHNDDERRYVNLALALACGALLLHTAVDFHLYHAPMLFLLGAYVGRLINQYVQRTGLSVLIVYPKTHCTAVGYFSILASISLLLAVSLIGLLAGFLSVRAATLDNRPSIAFAEMEKVHRFLPFVENYQTWEGALIAITVKKEQANLSIDKRDKLIHYALKKLDIAIKNNPIGAANHKYKAELLLLLPGKTNEAIEPLQKALALEPYQLDIRLELVACLEKAGATVKARQVLVDGFGKNYFTEVDQGINFLNKANSLIGSSSDSVAQKLALNKQLHELTSVKQGLDNLTPPQPGRLVDFTLADIVR